MRVTFDPAARDELDGIFTFIAEHNPRAALELIRRIEANVMRLEIPQLSTWAGPVSSKVHASFSNGRT
jgi:hypothetical protein